jgi:hypothetical protein
MAMAVGAGGTLFYLASKRNDATPSTRPVANEGPAVAEYPAVAALPAPPDAGTPAAGEADSGVDDSGVGRERRPTRKRRAASSSLSIDRVVRRHTGALQGCADKYAKDVTGQPQLQLRVSIDEDGRVTGANLTVPALNQTSLGRCLIDIVRPLRFGKQPEAFSFRIPLQIRASR